MRSFKDSNGEAWGIDLPFGTLTRIKRDSEGRFDLLYPESERMHPIFGKTNLQAVLMLDLEEFFELLYYLVRPECDRRGLTAEQFGQRMSGPQLLSARQVFLEEWRDFFQGLQRPDRVLSLDKMSEWMAKGTQALAEKVRSVSTEKMDVMIEQKLREVTDEADKGLQSILDS